MRQQEARREFAAEGAVRQEGPLPIHQCKFCGDEIVWATSAHTGNRFSVTVQHGAKGQRFYVKSAFHNCEDRQQWTVAARKAENTEAAILRINSLYEAGERDKAREVAQVFDETGEVT